VACGVWVCRGPVAAARRGAQVTADLLGDLAYPADDVGGGEEGGMADAHGRGPRVILDARERDARPGDGHDAVHHAHGQMLLLEERALLDVELEIGAEGTGNAGLGTEIADALELV